MISLLRKTLPFLLIAMLAAAAYDGWLFYSRWRDAREAERMRQAEEAERARRSIDLVGGGQFKILEFYAIPGAIRRGGHAEICYGVYGAKSVRIEPPVEQLRPALSQCFPVAPSKTTEYTLIAEDASGHTVTRRCTLQVAP